MTRPRALPALPALLLALAAASACAHAPARPAAAPADSVAPLVIGQTFTLDSPTLGERRRINVWVPDVYTDSAALRLPVLYMPDGGMREDFLHVAGLLEVSIGNGTMRPFILVGIENTERRRDMTGPTDVPRDSTIARHVGGSAAFRTFIRRELMPVVKSRYRTTNETAVMGESLAGLFVVETLVREPDLFDTYFAFDPSLWWNRARIVDEAVPAMRAASLSGKRLFMTSSDEPGIDTLAHKLAANLRAGAVPGLVWQYVPMPEEGHGTIYHPAALKAVRAMLGK